MGVTLTVGGGVVLVTAALGDGVRDVEALLVAAAGIVMPLPV